MGNCLLPQRQEKSLWVDVAGTKEVLQVVKTDGKILEYQVPMLVKDLLLNFTGYGIGVSENASQHLPPDYKMKVGHVYHLLPSFAASPERSSKTGMDLPDASKRIKLILTKQQLEEFLSKKMSVEDLLCSHQSCTLHDAPCTTIWRPRLETIPE